MVTKTNNQIRMFFVRFILGVMFFIPGMMKLMMPNTFKELMFDPLLTSSLIWPPILQIFNEHFSLFAITLGMSEMIIGLALILGLLPRLLGIITLIIGALLTTIWIPANVADVFSWMMVMMHVVIFIVFPILLYLKDSNAIFSPLKNHISESLKKFQFTS